ncbi:hypothetical protein CLF_103564 [Clonorchis sinensis]|uniref:Uncharacterized protein n=1 Tax=Clonorchis sinensis TaxID=79923 RepID=G7YNK0_CLOSI|nr:hypothetical protein CLF_103564 [Clonorchis sinensis]
MPFSDSVKARTLPIGSKAASFCTVSCPNHYTKTADRCEISGLNASIVSGTDRQLHHSPWHSCIKDIAFSRPLLSFPFSQTADLLPTNWLSRIHGLIHRSEAFAQVSRVGFVLVVQFEHHETRFVVHGLETGNHFRSSSLDTLNEDYLKLPLRWSMSDERNLNERTINRLAWISHRPVRTSRFSMLTGAMIRCILSRITRMNFQIFCGNYVNPLLEYANQVLCSGRKKDVLPIECVQRAFTKLVAGLKSVDYGTRVAVLDFFNPEYFRL